MANTFVFEDDDQQQPGFNSDEPEMPEEQQPEEGGEKSNRTFLLIAIGLGVIVLGSLICMAVYALVILPSRKQAQVSADATNAAVASFTTATAVSDQLTQAVALFTPTALPTEMPTLEPTNTPVIFSATDTPISGPTIESGTATQEALLTQLAISNSTATKSAQMTANARPTGPAGTSTAKAAATQTAAAKKLSSTGFADDVGLPGMFGLALVLVAVILLARRLRATPLSH